MLSMTQLHANCCVYSDTTNGSRCIPQSLCLFGSKVRVAYILVIDISNFQMILILDLGM